MTGTNYYARKWAVFDVWVKTCRAINFGRTISVNSNMHLGKSKKMFATVLQTSCLENLTCEWFKIICALLMLVSLDSA